MPNLVLQGLSNELYQELKVAARRNRCSLNGETIARFTASVRTEPVDTEGLLERIRLRRATIGRVDLSEGTLREMREFGRP